MVKCFNCEKEADEDDFCYGCNTHICAKCSLSSPWGTHEWTDHLEEEDDE